jgi:hypothetical protein
VNEAALMTNPTDQASRTTTSTAKAHKEQEQKRQEVESVVLSTEMSFFSDMTSSDRLKCTLRVLYVVSVLFLKYYGTQI